MIHTSSYHCLHTWRSPAFDEQNNKLNNHYLDMFQFASKNNLNFHCVHKFIYDLTAEQVPIE